MASIFNTLNIGYTGLSAAQVGINTTGHNISNAETEGYTRQRVVQSANTPLFTGAGNVGNGVNVQDIARVFDNFVFDRYTKVSGDKEYTDFSEKTLKELSSYFPEIDNVGIKADLAKYYDMWQTFADNPDTDAIKVALAKQTQTLSDHIGKTQSQIKSLQQQLNSELSVNIDEVNNLAKQLASLNKQIDVAEAGDTFTASDLRDRRNVIEKSLSRLVGAKVNSGQLESNMQIDTNTNTRTGSYTLSINDFNIVDGSSYHPLKLENSNNESGFYSLSYERQDGTLIPIEEAITSGKVGAILDLRGGAIDKTTGVPTDGIVQTVIAQMDAFAKGLIQATNNLYAASSTTKMSSNVLNLNSNTPIVTADIGIKKGAFEAVIYDIDGNEVARRSIKIDEATTMSGVTGSNSIQEKIKDNKDDNGDGNANNDVDDFINYNFHQAGDGTLRLEFALDPLKESQGYTFSLEDTLTSSDYASGSNFAGALGMGRFLDGDNASNISLTTRFQDNPTNLNAGYSGTSGDNRTALSMVQQQFEKYNFTVDNQEYNTTTYGMFDITATYVGISTNTAISQNETTTARFNSTELEYNSVSKVNMDEELTNLIKYQTSYGAAAKVISAVDQMMQTLLGIKQ